MLVERQVPTGGHVQDAKEDHARCRTAVLLPGPSDPEMPGSSDHAVLDGDLLDLRCRALVCNEKNLARANDPMEQLPPWDVATHRLQLSDVGWNL